MLWFTHIPIFGTLVNALGVVLGSLIGLAVRSRLPLGLTDTAFQGIGLFTLFLGVSMAQKSGNILILVFSLILGGITGEFLDLDGRLNRLALWIKERVHSENDRIVDGLVTAFLLFCIGSMTVLGAIEEGLGGTPKILLTKSAMDTFSSMALAASLGIGVLFAAVPLLFYQGGLTVAASFLQPILGTAVVAEITAAGGVLLIGLSLNILDIKPVKVMNLLPALVFAAFLGYFFT